MRWFARKGGMIHGASVAVSSFSPKPQSGRNSGMIEIRFGVQKIFLESMGGVALDTSFQRSTYKSRHVRVTKFVFLTVGGIEKELAIQFDVTDLRKAEKPEDYEID